MPQAETTGDGMAVGTAVHTAAAEPDPASHDTISESVAEPFGIPSPRYYLANEVGERARILDEVDPSPPELRDLSTNGRLLLSLWINEQGAVDRAEATSSDIDPAIEGIVIKQFAQARFAPAQLDGKPVKSQMKLEIRVVPAVATPSVIGKKTLADDGAPPEAIRR